MFLFCLFFPANMGLNFSRNTRKVSQKNINYKKDINKKKEITVLANNPFIIVNQIYPFSYQFRLRVYRIKHCRNFEAMIGASRSLFEKISSAETYGFL